LIKLRPTGGHDGNAGNEKTRLLLKFLVFSDDGKADAATICDGFETFAQNALFAVAADKQNVKLEK
jgi:hypothetical protein